MINGSTFGHAGACSTNMTVDPEHRLITVFMVQNAAWRNAEGKKIEPTFRQAAIEMFAK